MPFVTAFAWTHDLGPLWTSLTKVATSLAQLIGLSAISAAKMKLFLVVPTESGLAVDYARIEGTNLPFSSPSGISNRPQTLPLDLRGAVVGPRNPLMIIERRVAKRQAKSDKRHD
jgi:hypothetical protein